MEFLEYDYNFICTDIDYWWSHIPCVLCTALDTGEIMNIFEFWFMMGLVIGLIPSIVILILEKRCDE